MYSCQASQAGMKASGKGALPNNEPSVPTSLQEVAFVTVFLEVLYHALSHSWVYNY